MKRINLKLSNFEVKNNKNIKIKEMPSTRRPNRSTRSTLTSPLITAFSSDACNHKYLSIPQLYPTEQPPSPKHFPFPNTAPEDDLFFEIITTIYTITAAGLQFVHMYRTVWWLPHSHNKYAINFYLIDDYLTLFITVILSRRLLYLTGCKLLKKAFGDKLIVTFYYKMFLFTAIFTCLSVCIYDIMQNHHVEKILYLCYPFVIYTIFFGFKIDPFFELTSWLTTKTTLPPLHACSCSPIEIRAEVDNLIRDFNYRIKEILFSTILNAYYAGFIPCCFAQSTVYYDTLFAAQHIVFIFLSCFIAFFIHVISLKYCDVLHRSSLHLGVWEKLETARNVMLVNNIWKDDVLWPYGALVRYGRDVFRAHGDCNAAEPTNVGLTRFYYIFKNPAYNLGVLLIVQMSIVVYQLILLIKSTLWHNLLSLTIMLLFNYYVLYRLFRDYLISHKIYAEERELHKKVHIR